MTYVTTHTLKLTLVFIALTLSFFLGATSKAHAYVATDEAALRVGDSAALFVIEYEFGRENEEMFMPILAKEGTSRIDNTLSYVILDENDEEVHGKSTGIVISNARIEDGSYVTPLHEAKKFLLFVLFVPETMDGLQEYRMQVTQLPFSLDGEIEQQLNPSELKQYKTSSIEI